MLQFHHPIRRAKRALQKQNLSLNSFQKRSCTDSPKRSYGTSFNLDRIASTALVFPGQGTQFVGMCKDLFNQFRSAKRIIEEANDTLKLRLDKIMFEGSNDL